MMTAEVLICGVLEKKASKPPKRYQKRYFEVCRRYQGRQETVVGHFLNYYKNDNKAVLKGTLDLSDCESVENSPVDLRGVVLHMSCNQKVELRARDEAAAIAWAEGLDALLGQYSDGDPHHTHSEQDSKHEDGNERADREAKRIAMARDEQEAREKRAMQEQLDVQTRRDREELKALEMQEKLASAALEALRRQAKLQELQQKRDKYDAHFVEMNQRCKTLPNSFDGHLREARVRAFQTKLVKAARATPQYQAQYPLNHYTLGISERGITDFLRRIGWEGYERDGTAAAATEYEGCTRRSQQQRVDGLDLSQVFESFLRESGNEHLSICELLWNEACEDVGPADAFLSHVESISTADTLYCMQQAPRQYPSELVGVDPLTFKRLFSRPDQQAVKLRVDVKMFVGSFGVRHCASDRSAPSGPGQHHSHSLEATSGAVAEIGIVIANVGPEGEYFSCPRCLFEALCAARSNSVLRVVCPPGMAVKTVAAMAEAVDSSKVLSCVFGTKGIDYAEMDAMIAVAFALACQELSNVDVHSGGGDNDVDSFDEGGGAGHRARETASWDGSWATPADSVTADSITVDRTDSLDSMAATESMGSDGDYEEGRDKEKEEEDDFSRGAQVQEQLYLQQQLKRFQDEAQHRNSHARALARRPGDPVPMSADNGTPGRRMLPMLPGAVGMRGDESSVTTEFNSYWNRGASAGESSVATTVSSGGDAEYVRGGSTGYDSNDRDDGDSSAGGRYSDSDSYDANPPGRIRGGSTGSIGSTPSSEMIYGRSRGGSAASIGSIGSSIGSKVSSVAAEEELFEV
jgi:hypothetical protein